MIHTNAGRAVVAPSTMASVASAAVTALEPAGPTGSTRLRRSRGGRGEFVYRLLHNPDTQLHQILDHNEWDRADLGRVEKEVQVLLDQMIAVVGSERDGYVRPAAKRRISEEDLQRYLAEIEQRKGRPGRPSKGCAISERGSQSSTSSPP